MAQLRHIRLNAGELENLRNCLQRLDTIHDTIGATSMVGKLACQALCVEVYRAIEAVLMREAALIARIAQGPEIPDAAPKPQE